MTKESLFIMQAQLFASKHNCKIEIDYDNLCINIVGKSSDELALAFELDEIVNPKEIKQNEQSSTL
jgi:hypothetical protein